MLPLFPEHVLDNSLHTAILVGLVVTWALFELFGWVFAGFVVSGYLCALAVVSPTSLAVVLVESILCYGLVWLLGIATARGGLWSSVFGRERFLLFVLVALPVRLLVTGLAMPNLEAHLLTAGVPPERLGLGLFGIGVVLVPLTANTFWKLGIRRGLVQLATTSGLTWAVVAGLLVPFTNFGFGSFEQSFDAMASSAWTSSRPVLVLLVTVFLAARANLRFGWDFGGILVPSLLAMLVFQPLKLVTTLGEIAVLFFLYERLVRLPGVRDLDLEGPRRVVSIYAVAYAYKWCVAWAVSTWGVPFGVSDVFGFGYLLTSLVVARAHKVGRLLPTLAPLVGVAGSGVAIALPLALALDRLPYAGVELQADPSRRDLPPAEAVPLLATRAYALPRTRAHGSEPASVAAPPLLQVRPPQGCTALEPARAQDPAHPWTLACASEGPVLVVPRPRGDPDAAWLAGWVMADSDIAGVVVASVDPSRHPTRSGRGEEAVQATVHAAQRWAPERPRLVVVSAEDGAPGLVLRDPRSIGRVLDALRVPGLQLHTGEIPAAALGVWDQLGPDDGVLVLPLSLVPAGPIDTAPDLETALTGSPRERPRHDVLLDALVLPSARRAAAAGAVALPGHLLHLAALVGAHWVQVPSPEGTDWVLVRGTPQGSDRWILRPGGSPWTVLAAQCWRWPGLVGVAAHHHRTLEARLTHVVAQPPAEDARRRTAAAGMPLQERLVRAALIPPPGADEDVARLLVLDVAPAHTPAVLLSQGNELVDATTAEQVADAVSAAFAPWPGARYVTPGSPESAWQPTLAYAVTYQQALAPDRLLLAWYPSPVLRESPDAPDRSRLHAWYASAGIAVLRPGEARTRAAALRVEDPVRAPGLQAVVQEHQDLRTEVTLLRLTEDPRRRVEVWDLGLRLVVAVTEDGVTCTAVAGGTPAPSWPWSGCWRSR